MTRVQLGSGGPGSASSTVAARGHLFLIPRLYLGPRWPIDAPSTGVGLADRALPTPDLLVLIAGAIVGSLLNHLPLDPRLQAGD